MKSLVYAFIITILIACNKDKDSTPTTFNTYQATVKENFTDPFKRIENIQVGDFIPYTIAIEDSGDDENVEYRLTSIRESQDYHQTIWKDFGLYLKKDDTAPYNKEKKYVSFYRKGNYDFYIRPFVPGTFKLNFELQKFINGEIVGNPTKLEFIFNAINILIGEKKVLHPFIMQVFNYCYIEINDGNEKGDNYLSSQNSTQTCKVTFMFKNKEMNREGYFEGEHEFILINNQSAGSISIKNMAILNL